jgi:hypothetical protein
LPIVFPGAVSILVLLTRELDQVKKELLAIATIFLVPGMLVAATPGAYCDSAPALVAQSPAPFSFSDVCPYLHRLATLPCVVISPCRSLTNNPLDLGPHPASGELRGSFAPGNESFPIIALTSVPCSNEIGRQEAEAGMRSILCIVG